MGIKEVLKSNKVFRSLGKKYNIKKQFKQDSKDFSKYYIEAAKDSGDYSYSIMLIIHSLEKGMCFPNPRPFGVEKVGELMLMLDSYPEEKQAEFEYRMGISMLQSWANFYKNHGWENKKEYIEVTAFLEDKIKFDCLKTGCKEYRPELSEEASELYEKNFLMRHSVRDFQNKLLKEEDINFALKCFVETPTACNRQMCKVYYVSNYEMKEMLNKTIIGIPGFNKENVQYFVITYDIASFAYSGERNQGLFNAGLCTMNFINGLHAKGIGSCCLQWSNKNKEDYEVRTKLGLKKSERIGIIVAAGYYLEDNIIPCSVRRKPEEVFKII